MLDLSLTDVRLGWSDCWQGGQRGGWTARRADKRAITPCQSQSCQRCAQIPGSTDSTGQARLPATFLGESQWRAEAECKLTIWDFSRQRHQFNIFDLLQQPVKDELPWKETSLSNELCKTNWVVPNKSFPCNTKAFFSRMFFRKRYQLDNKCVLREKWSNAVETFVNVLSLLVQVFQTVPLITKTITDFE